MILLIDNYDSFVYNIARYLEELGEETLVFRNNVERVEVLMALEPGAIVISPGPGRPSDAGVSVDLILAAAGKVPVLGICLGHQAIAEAFGGRTILGREPLHGHATAVEHDGTGVFRDLPSPLRVGRYHSLVVDASSVPEDLEIQAWSPTGEVMALRHRQWPIHGVQFHPESILTPHGYELLQGFLGLVRALGSRSHGEGETPESGRRRGTVG